MAEMNVDEVLIDSRSITQAYRSMLSDAAKPYQMMDPHFEILIWLKRFDHSLTDKAIRRLTGRSGFRNRQFFDDLRRSGYIDITRDNVDRDAVRITLTEKSNQIADAAIAAHNAFFDKMFDGIDEQTQALLVSTMQKMVENLNKE